MRQVFSFNLLLFLRPLQDFTNSVVFTENLVCELMSSLLFSQSLALIQEFLLQIVPQVYLGRFVLVQVTCPKIYRTHVYSAEGVGCN